MIGVGVYLFFRPATPAVDDDWLRRVTGEHPSAISPGAEVKNSPVLATTM